MKRLYFCVAFLALLFYVVNAANDEPRPVMAMNEETEEVVSSVKHRTDANFFRAQGVGNARHLNTAKIKARMAANIQLSNEIRNWIDDFMRKYVNNLNDVPSGCAQAFDVCSPDVIEEQIGNASVVSDQTEYTDEDIHNVSIVIEIKRKKVFEAFERMLAADKQLGKIYDRQKLQALFKNEIEEMRKQNR